MPGKADVVLEEQVKGAAPCCTCLGGTNSLLLTRGELRGSWQAQSRAAGSCGKRLYSSVGQGEKSEAKQGTWEAYFIWLLPFPLQLFYFRLFTRPEFFLYSSLLTVVSLFGIERS